VAKGDPALAGAPQILSLATHVARKRPQPFVLFPCCKLSLRLATPARWTQYESIVPRAKVVAEIRAVKPADE